MYKSILILLAASTAVAASNSEIEKIFADFETLQKSFYSQEMDQTNLKAKVTAYMLSVNESLVKIQKLEAKKKPIALSEEGTELALEIELVEPIQKLAASDFGADACGEASQLNEVNAGKIQEAYDRIQAVLNKFCSK